MFEGKDDRPDGNPRIAAPDPIQIIREALASLRFGGIQLTVHDGKIVQMEVTEKHRFHQTVNA